MATTSSTNSVALDSISARHNPRMTSRRILSLVAVFALLVFSWRFAQVRPGVFLQPATAAAIWNFLRRLLLIYALVLASDWIGEQLRLRVA